MFFISTGTESTTKLDSEANVGLSSVTKLVEEMSEKLLDGTIQLRQLYAIVGDEDRLQRFLDIYKVFEIDVTCYYLCVIRKCILS